MLIRQLLLFRLMVIFVSKHAMISYTMKCLPLFLITMIVVAGCSEDETTKIECRLTKIVVKGPHSVTETEYTYNTSGKMLKQVRTRNGVNLFDYTYSYNSDGKVDEVDIVDRYFKYEYAPDGKIAIITTYSMSGTVNERAIYTWSGNNVEIKHSKPEMPNHYQITEFEFLNDNLVKRTYKSFTGTEPNVLTNVVETRFEDFDTALSAFYVASSTRPGFTAEISKNNPRKQIETNIFYDGGLPTEESIYTTVFSYTYNDSNAMLTSKAVTNGTDVVDTEITYDKCN